MLITVKEDKVTHYFNYNQVTRFDLYVDDSLIIYFNSGSALLIKIGGQEVMQGIERATSIKVIINNKTREDVVRGLGLNQMTESEN